MSMEAKALASSLPGLEASWSLGQELSLLAAVERVGPSSWEEVARLLATSSSEDGRSQEVARTQEQLRQHFNSVYVEGRSEEPALAQACRSAPPPPLSCPTSTCLPLLAPLERPPRPPLLPLGTSNPSFRDSGGYNPGRADFSSPPDPRAEVALASVAQEPASLLEEELQVALVGAYNSRLEARARAYRLVREQGLIRRAKGPEGDGLARFGQILCATDLDWIREGLAAEQQLRARVIRLQELRRQGVSQLGLAPLLSSLQGVRRQQEAELEGDLEGGRRAAAPLDILGLPGTERLGLGERRLSSNLRILPREFARLRSVLVEASRERGGLLLAEARPLLRIDVNKTRRIFDFLVEKGDINSKT